MKLAIITMYLQKISFHNHLIARHYHLFEFNIVHATKQSNLTTVFLWIKHGNTANLSHSLQNQNTWHNSLVREMSVELWLIIGYILDAYSRFEWINFDNSIYQQKWSTMGQNLLYFVNFQYHIKKPLLFIFYVLFAQLCLKQLGHGCIQCMT